jgi:flagellin
MQVNNSFNANVLANLLSKSSDRVNNLAAQMASGLSINRASDNAAGLSVATAMTTQSNAYMQGMQNSNDGISLIQTADAASGSMADLLQRQRDLALQSMNGTNSDADRAAMNAEFTQLTSEMSRIASTTKFNGQPLLTNLSAAGNVQNGTPSPINIATGDGSVSIALANFSPEATGGIFGNTPYTGIGIGSSADASLAVERIDAALGQIGSVRAQWGATENRLGASIENMASANVNTLAARSRIQDMDYARSLINLSKEQTLQQAGIALFAQSKQNSQQVLSLLGMK